jgi:polyphenol oxidase
VKLKLKEEAMFFSFVECDAFCVFTMKINGNMKGEEGRENREVFFEKYLPKSVKKIIMAEQIHSNSVEVVGGRSPVIIRGVDGLVTREREIALLTFGADCIDMPLCDQNAGVIGNIHLGRQGILQRGAHNIVSKMIGQGAKKDDIELIIGPGICGKCYEYDEKDAGIFKLYDSFISNGENGSGKVFIDLTGILLAQLTEEIGIPAGNIRRSEICTFENSSFFSQRRDRNNPIETGMAFIGLR